MVLDKSGKKLSAGVMADIDNSVLLSFVIEHVKLHAAPVDGEHNER